jgi:LPXTG-motif cell wall-anchored protein
MFAPALALPAFAASVCPVGSNPIAVGSAICEVEFSGAGTWTPPAGVSTVEALLVGAGGASDGFYGGGGGDVRIVELGTSGEVTVVVGVGGIGQNGSASSVAQGSLSQSALGGVFGDFFDGDSGNGEDGGLSGGGAGGAASGGLDGEVGGIGLIVSELESTLFNNNEACLGGGGGGFFFTAESQATCGGGFFSDFVRNTGTSPPWNANTGSVTQSLPVVGSGGGGGPLISFDSTASNSVFSPGAGANGQVVIRFALAAAPVEAAAPRQLAATGLTEAQSLLGAAGLLVAAGAGLFAYARRSRLS